MPIGFKCRLSRTVTAASIAALAILSPALADDRALVIGIDDYNALGSALSLKGAVADANAFRGFLIDDWGFAEDQVTLLTDADASSAAIMDAVIDHLIGETTRGDRVVFYFAGLGGRVDGDTDESDAKSEVLIAHDADAYLGKMPEKVFTDLFDLLEGREVTIVVDASAAGDAALMAGAPGGTGSRGLALGDTHDEDRGEMVLAVAETDAASFTERPFGAGNARRSIWAAAAPSQYAWETGGRGVFTRHFIEGLRSGAADQNDNGIVSHAELLNHLTRELGDWCAGTPECVGTGLGLTPHFDGDVTAAFDLSSASIAGIEPTNMQDLTGNSHESFEARLAFVSDLFAPQNDAGLKMRIEGSDPLKIGEAVQFQFRAERNGTLVLLDVNPNGELAQVYPSALAPKDGTRMTSGQILSIPNAIGVNGLPLEIRVTEPAGQGFLVALFVEDELTTLEATLPENLAGGPIPNATEYLYQTAQALLEMQAAPDGNHAVSWSAVYLPYEIVP